MWYLQLGVLRKLKAVVVNHLRGAEHQLEAPTMVHQNLLILQLQVFQMTDGFAPYVLISMRKPLKHLVVTICSVRSALR